MKKNCSRTCASTAYGYGQILLFTLLFFLLSNPSTCVEALSADNAIRARLGEAFTLVLDVERAGGDTGELVASLNEALKLIRRGESTGNGTQAEALFKDAERIIDEAILAAGYEREAGLAAQRTAGLRLTVSVCLLAASVLLAYVFVPEVFWTLWLRIHRDWRVEPR
ncbi:MAG: hypothetical protein QXK96_06545 [Candidatus Bathyarchaeia archaeon]